ncbi:cupin domain-containing protein [Pseudoalteromonas spongiae]|uniref:cupin domain-containing protein n=1 Tax=Pseudoalteromonas spongiae TaxID=298657 RepID=UPI003735E32D
MRKVLLACVIFALLFGNAFAADTNVKPAHIASPNQYELLLDNEEVTVLKMTLKPGEQDNWHKHNAETVYFEKGGKATITTSEKDMTLEIPDGYVMWHDQWEHQVKNVGKTTITAIIVEKKQ